MKEYFDRKAFVGLLVGFIWFVLTFIGYSGYKEYSDYTTNVKPFVYALKQRAAELQQQAQRQQQAKPTPAPAAQPETPKQQ